MVQDSLSPEAIAAAAASAGLTLTDDQLADLVAACRAYAPVLARLPRDTKVEILADPGTGWVKLRPLTGGPVGWMADYLLTNG